MTEPLHIISLGAGVQSSTLALMASAGEITPMPNCAIFADTQDEPASVYQWLEYLIPKLTFPVLQVSKGRLSESSLKMKTTKDGRLFSRTDIPFYTLNHDGSSGKIRQRQCTRDFKIWPIIRRERELLGSELKAWRKKHRPALKILAAYKKAMVLFRKKLGPHVSFPSAAWDECQSDPMIVQWIGISRDEIKRMKPSREPWIVHRWPLVDAKMTREGCLKWMEARGHPRPPRSACVYCPFHDNEEWKRLKEQEPEAFARAVAFEREIQRVKAQSQNFKTTPFLHRSNQNIDTVDFDKLIAEKKAKQEAQGEEFGFTQECEGMCGI